MNQAKEKDKERGEGEKIIGLAYDGRKDNIRVMVPDSRGKLHVRVIKEEHISGTEEPSGSYLSDFTPDPPVYPDKPAKKVAEALYDLLLKKTIH